MSVGNALNVEHATQSEDAALRTYRPLRVRQLAATSGAAGAKRATLAYTAFGEPVGPVPGDYPRYQYAGGYDYESGLLTLNGAAGTAPIRLQHVGYRWYQPGIGRFVQRDPIGLEGGPNCYVYAGNNPVASVDPVGLLTVGPSGEEELPWKWVKERDGQWKCKNSQGRYIKQTWWRKLQRPGLPRFGCFLFAFQAGCWGADTINWALGSPYDSSQTLFYDIGYYLCLAGISEFRNAHQRRQNPQVYRRPELPDYNGWGPDYICY